VPPVSELPQGLIAFVKKDCPTCLLIEPVLRELANAGPLKIYSQDDPYFPDGLPVEADLSLDTSYRAGIEIVPTLIRVGADGVEQRLEGWHADEWRGLTGVENLGEGLPDWRPGCGSLSVDPNREPELRARYGSSGLQSRRIDLAAAEDEFEAMMSRGVSDGLPVVPPTESRVLAMLTGTQRDPQSVVAEVPPDLAPCTVEKVAINAVMAGCLPEYMPVILAAIEAICTDSFNMHGVLATTMPVGPVFVVNGEIARRIGMNSGKNVFGQGNRANLTIGRAVQLVVRNVGGGRPGEIDRATFGQPGKLSFCFAELEADSPFGTLAESFGVPAGRDAVTAFCGEAPRSIVDQLARDPDSLVASYAACIRSMHHPKLVMGFDAMLAVGPEHGRVFREAGWDRARLVGALEQALVVPGVELMRGAGGMAEGFPIPPEKAAGLALPKLRPGGLHLVYCGGGAGLFAAVIGGWLSGPAGSVPVVKEICP
jgi:hypothetical protein